VPAAGHRRRPGLVLRQRLVPEGHRAGQHLRRHQPVRGRQTRRRRQARPRRQARGRRQAPGPVSRGRWSQTPPPAAGPAPPPRRPPPDGPRRRTPLAGLHPAPHPPPRRREVPQPLTPLLAKAGPREAALGALKTWVTRENIAALAKLVNEAAPQVWGPAMDAL